MYRVHGHRRLARRYAAGSTCEACLRHYSTRTLLVYHLQRSRPQCLAALVARGPSVSEEEALALDRQESTAARKREAEGLFRNSATEPWYRTEGPIISEGDLHKDISRAICLEALGLPDDERTNRAPMRSECELRPMRELDIAAAPPPDTVTCGTEVPRTIFVRTVVILHLFSGIRRHGDLQQHLERADFIDGIQVLVISLDIAISKHGNILDDEVIEWWKAQIRAGYCFGGLAGPPCETWSAARLLDEGPPALRSPEWPWGMPQVTAKFHEQLRVGSALLIAALAIAAELLIAGGCFCTRTPE